MAIFDAYHPQSEQVISPLKMNGLIAVLWGFL